MEHLGLALALATLAGLNLYLTVFMVGLAVRLDWFAVADTAALEGFGNPAVMGVALVLFLVEFLLDKVPWADSLWDSIHTFLRPAGGALLALGALSPEAGGFAQTGVTVLGVAAALLTHSTKAGLRLRLNTSPEPFSNVIASVAEDLCVVGGFWFAVNQPGLALWVFLGLLVLAGFVARRLYRSSRAILWLLWKKVRMPAGAKAKGRAELGKRLSAEDALAVAEHFPAGEFEPAFAQPCVSGKSRGAPGLAADHQGVLVAAEGRAGRLYFVRRKGLRGRAAVEIDASGCEVNHESRFLSESLVLSDKSRKLLLQFHLHRGQFALAAALADYLQTHGATEEPERVDDRGTGGGDSAPAAERDEEKVDVPAEPARDLEPGPIAAEPGIGTLLGLAPEREEAEAERVDEKEARPPEDSNPA